MIFSGVLVAAAQLSLAAVLSVSPGAGGDTPAPERGEPLRPIVRALRDPIRCNGHAVLCDRRVNEVTFAATHNSMNAAALGWLWPNQQDGLRAQLDGGIRGFLIDTHYWESQEKRDAYARQLTPAQRTEYLAKAREQGQPWGLYLCHVVCAPGNTGLVGGLATFTEFLAEHRREVIILAIEDHISPQDTEDAFRESGLLNYVYVHQRGTPWPTLRTLIRQNRRVIVTAENRGVQSTWYAPLYDEAWDTPYTVSNPTQFDCRLARGRRDQSLLLLNHWIARRIPSPADAARVNQYDTLMAHAQTCVTEHRKAPNLVAVDFAAIGDLLRVVDTLNGVIPVPVR